MVDMIDLGIVKNRYSKVIGFSHVTELDILNFSFITCSKGC